MLDVRHLSCGYNQSLVVHDVSFQVSKGEHISIIGPNGCGKSTLLKSIVGLIPYQGEISLEAKNIKQYKRKEAAGKIAFMNQITGVYFSYTVFETVLLGRYPKMNHSAFSHPTSQDIEYVNQSLEAVDIFHLKDRSIMDLSGGELQRVFLAKVFAQDPEIILLDEPTNHLDLQHQLELMNYLKKWSSKGDKIVVAVLHDINLALSFADKILLMSQGKALAFDHTAAILKTDLLNQVYGLNVKEYMVASYKRWNT